MDEFSDSDFDSLYSSSDESDLEILLGHPKQKNENYLEHVVPQYDRCTFREHFRLNREVAEDIARRYTESNQYTQQSGQYGKLSGYHQILIFLWFIGHQTASFRDVSDRFDISLSSLFRVVRRVSVFLSNLSPQFIRWPTEEEKRRNESSFRMNGFPGVIGAIDGTHIKIDKPSTDHESYINRKGYYSIHLQAVCDQDAKFIDVFVGYPGSVHDSRVFRNSPLGRQLEDMCNNYFLLGDSGYPLQKNLLTPFRDRGQLSRRQVNYNIKLSKSRCVVEHSFGLLKQKFRQLYHLKLRCVVHIVHFIRAACVLHNISLEDHFDLQEEPVVEDPMRGPYLDDYDNEDDVNAKAIRNNIVNTLRM